MMNNWSAWSSCDQLCGCGLKHKSRTVKVEARGHGKKCLWPSEASTCNCNVCHGNEAKPAASSHGFVPDVYKPDGGFKSKSSEQGACLVDKAAAIIDLYLASVDCTRWNDEFGSTCYPKSASHVIGAVRKCCNGRDHFKLWSSDELCERDTAAIIDQLKDVVMPTIFSCVQATERGKEEATADVPECRPLHTERMFREFAKITVHTLKAAQQLYARGDASDLVPAASQFLHACDVVGHVRDASGTIVSTWKTPAFHKCQTQVMKYIKTYSPKFAMLEQQHSAPKHLRGTS
eukprot:g5810.t1